MSLQNKFHPIVRKELPFCVLHIKIKGMPAYLTYVHFLEDYRPTKLRTGDRLSIHCFIYERESFLKCTEVQSVTVNKLI